MDEYTLDDYDADIKDYFQDEIELIRAPEKGEFVAMDISKSLGITSNIVTRRMNKAVRNGKATSRMWRNNEGRTVPVYKWVK